MSEHNPSESIPNRSLPDPAVISMPMTSDEFIELKNRVKVLETTLVENTALTHKGIKIAEETRDSTRDLVTFTQNAQGALNSVNWIIKLFKPFAVLGLGVTATYALWIAMKAWLVAAIQSGQIK